MACKFGYSRRTHLVVLLSALITYAALIAALVTTNDRHRWILGIWVALLFVGWLVCIVFWLLRARPLYFPMFHFVTLCIEFVYYCVALASLIFWSAFYALRLINEFDMWLLLVTAIVLLLALEYAFLMFVTLPVPYVLLRGSVVQKAELAAHVSIAAVNLPEAAGVKLPGATTVSLPGAIGVNLPGASGVKLPGATGVNLPGATTVSLPGAIGVNLPGATGVNLQRATGVNLPGAAGLNLPAATGLNLPGATGAKLPGYGAIP